MSDNKPMNGFTDEHGTVIPSPGALLRHVELHNERNAEWHGAPEMPLTLHPHASGKFGLVFGPVGMQEMTFSEAWTAINHLSTGWAAAAHAMGRAV